MRDYYGDICPDCDLILCEECGECPSGPCACDDNLTDEEFWGEG